MGTVARNVAVGDETPDDGLVREALDLAGATELQEELVLGVAGQGLSGGQAQRVALARAYYRALRHDVPFLVLDEVSSALDQQTEAVVMRGIESMAARGHGILLISHRDALTSLASTVVPVWALEGVR
jgi:ATP-binding cassette subfamily C protein CydD